MILQGSHIPLFKQLLKSFDLGSFDAAKNEKKSTTAYQNHFVCRPPVISKYVRFHDWKLLKTHGYSSASARVSGILQQSAAGDAGRHVAAGAADREAGPGPRSIVQGSPRA